MIDDRSTKEMVTTGGLTHRRVAPTELVDPAGEEYPLSVAMHKQASRFIV
jgi:hypothetical protein